MPHVCDDLDALVEDGSVVYDPETGQYHERHSGVQIVDWRSIVGHSGILATDGDEEDLYHEPPPLDHDNDPSP